LEPILSLKSAVGLVSATRLARSVAGEQQWPSNDLLTLLVISESAQWTSDRLTEANALPHDVILLIASASTSILWF